MNALDMLHRRSSSPVLSDPAPTPAQLEVLWQAAARAPDHALLRPYRFLVIEGPERAVLGELFVKAASAKNSQIEATRLEKIRSMPLRAPMLLVAVAVTQDHPKVPEVEQVITAGCATQAIIQAAFALGLGAMWRTGEMAFDTQVKAGLGLQSHEQIIGFIYLGSSDRQREPASVNSAEFVARWPETC